MIYCRGGGGEGEGREVFGCITKRIYLIPHKAL